MIDRKNIVQYIVFDWIAAMIVWLLFYVFRRVVNDMALFGDMPIFAPSFNFYLSMALYPVMALGVHYLSGFYKIYNSSSTPTGRCGIYQDVIVSANTNYTFSVNITSYCYITLGFGGSFGNVIYNGAETKRFVYNFNTSSNTSVRICIAAYDGNAAYCYHPQLELGDKATDWRTAPEDLAIYSIDINFVGGSVINSGKSRS